MRAGMRCRHAPIGQGRLPPPGRPREGHPRAPPRIDGLRYACWFERVFRQIHEGGVDAVHVTLAHHEAFRRSLLAAGCCEAEAPGLTRMGREVVAEMSRVGMAVDVNHLAERSTPEAVERSSRLGAITHVNPAS